MNTLHPNDKVICIDATPFPYTHGFSYMDFYLPAGFVTENAIYCVTRVKIGSDGLPSLQLAGKPVFLGNIEVQWHGSRFRKLASEKKEISRSAKQTLPNDTI